MRPFRHTHLILFFGLLVFSLQSKGQIHVSGGLCVGTGGSASSCANPTLFFDKDTNPGVDGWQWDFGDSKTSTLRNAQNNYTIAGTYTVKLTRLRGGVVVNTDTKSVIISDFTQPLLKGKEKGKYNDKCAGPITLDPYASGSPPAGAKYKWFPDGQTTKTIDVENTGCYSVEVTNANGCSKIAQIEVEFCLGNPNTSSSPPVWYFGNQGGIEFGPTYPPDSADDCDDPTKECYLIGKAGVQPIDIGINPIKASNKINSPESSAMVFNKDGALVLYSDGKQVYDSNDAIVGGATSLSGSNNLPQSTIIVPKSTCNECPSHMYYVVSLNKDTKVLSYSLIDIRGAKQVIEANIPLATNMAGRITSTPSTSGFQIITHEVNNSNFKTFTIDTKGITEGGFTIGSPFTSPESQVGTMKYSDLGTKFAVTLVENGQNYIELYNVDAASGGLSDHTKIFISNAPPNIYGLEFSPQTAGASASELPSPPKYLYATVGSKIYQIDIATKTSKLVFTDGLGTTLGAMKIGPPQEGFPKFIVFTRNNESQVGAIDFPETANPTIRPQTSSTAGVSGLGLPEITRPKTETAGAGLQLKYKGRCAGSPTIFTVQPLCSDKGKPIYYWDFGDGKSMITYAIPFVTHTYDKAGDFPIKLRIKIVGCGEREYKSSVSINPTPIINTSGLIPVCDLPEGTPVNIEIDPKVTGGSIFEYRWVRGLGTNLGIKPTIVAKEVAKYSVFIKNEKKCSNTKEFEVVRVCEPQLFVPDVFTPNAGDNQNDVFRFFPYFMSKMKISIYDRWGVLVYQKEQPKDIPYIIGFDQTNVDILRDMFWDGKDFTSKKECFPGVYAYEIEYVEEFTINKYLKTQKGSILLIR